MPRPVTMDHLRSRKKPVIERVPIVLDTELADRLEAAKTEYEAARTSFEARATDASRERFIAAEDAYEAAKTEAEDNVAVFVFRGIGRRPFDDLVDAHLPTKEQKERAKREGSGDITWNPESFPPALVSAASVEPKLSVEEAQEIWESPEWNQAEIMAVFFGALNANSQRRITELGKDYGTTNGSG